MTRSIPADSEIFAETSQHAILPFLRIDHPSLAEPIRVVSDIVDYSWSGETWVGVPFGFRLLTDGEAAPETQIVVQNVDRAIGTALRKMSGSATISLWILTSADFPPPADPPVSPGVVTPLYAFEGYDLVDVTINPIQISGRVVIRDYATESYPGVRATQSRCPGLFA